MTNILYISLFLISMELNLLSLLMFFIMLILFIIMIINNYMLVRRIRNRKKQTIESGLLMKKALEISQNNVLRFDIRDQHIYTLYGDLYPKEGLALDEWKSRIHPDDLEMTLSHFRKILKGTKQLADFTYRWNAEPEGDNPHWLYLHDVTIAEYQPGMNRPISLISTLSDDTELQQAIANEGELMDKYRIIFENSIIGLSFYSSEGWLLDTNQMMRNLCHFDNTDYDAHFSETNLFDDPPFRECCDRNNLQELWICTQSIIPERDIHDYLEIRLHPIRDNEGKLIYIAIATRNVTEERELYLHAKQNDIDIQKANELIMNFEVELNYMMEACKMQPWRINFEKRTIEYYKGLNTISFSCSLEEMQQQFVDQDDPMVKILTTPEEHFSSPVNWTGRVYPVFSHRDSDVWVQINSIPEYDENGRQTGCFGLWRDITSLMSKQEALKHETERANDSARLKSVFLANMTHEIRTPLNAIVGFTDLLTAIDDQDSKREMVRVIHNNCDMLIRLINDILLLSNADANAMELKPANIDASKEFDDICQTLVQRVQNPSVEFITDNPYSVCHTCLDSARIHQVITNFVTNAVKYTHQGHIKVGYRIQIRNEKGEVSNDGNGRQGLYLYCEDTGTGIPKNQLKRIFERFVKLNDYIQGTGLGLSICQVIIEKCGGKIGVDSEEGKGSTFWFWIPAEIYELKNKTENGSCKMEEEIRQS